MKKGNEINLYLKSYFKSLIIFFMLISSYNSYANSLNKTHINSIYNINICKSKEFLSICIDLDKEYLVNLKLLNDPYRIILDFDKKLNFHSYDNNKKIIENNLFISTRFAQRVNNKSRLVFELNKI